MKWEKTWTRFGFTDAKGKNRDGWKLTLQPFADATVLVVEATKGCNLFMGKKRAGNFPTADEGKREGERILLTLAEEIKEEFGRKDSDVCAGAETTD